MLYRSGRDGVSRGTCHSYKISLSHYRLVFYLSLVATPKAKRRSLSDNEISSSTASAGVSIGGIVVVSLSLVDDSASPSTNPPLSLSRSCRRFRVSGALFDDSASLSISSTPPRISRSPRRLRVSLNLLDASAYLSLSAYLKLITPPISSEIKPKEKSNICFFMRLMRCLCLFVSRDSTDDVSVSQYINRDACVTDCSLGLERVTDAWVTECRIGLKRQRDVL
ncbi:hypothetical protein YC2023_048773 [Brassica napus]